MFITVTQIWIENPIIDEVRMLRNTTETITTEKQLLVSVKRIKECIELDERVWRMYQPHLRANQIIPKSNLISEVGNYNIKESIFEIQQKIERARLGTLFEGEE